MFTRSKALLAVAAALLLAAVLRAGARSASLVSASLRSQRWTHRAAAWLACPTLPLALVLLAGAYGAWALLAQNIDKPRHITPLIGINVVLLLALFRPTSPSGPAGYMFPHPNAARKSWQGFTGYRRLSLAACRLRRAQLLCIQHAIGALYSMWRLALTVCVITLQAVQGSQLAARSRQANGQQSISLLMPSAITSTQLAALFFIHGKKHVCSNIYEPQSSTDV